MKPLSLYIHIPFCIKKCLYCDFLSFPGDEETKEAYVQALCEEIRAESENYKEYRTVTVFLGGGTPSVLSERQIVMILGCVKENFCMAQNPEITIEANPGTVTTEKLDIFLKAGINRISFGLQSGENKDLRQLGRIHTWEDFLKSWEWAEKAGFVNRNIDLMSALPGQTLDSYVNSLRKAAALEPEHISAYSLIIEEGTLFYERYGGGKVQTEYPALPGEEEERQMYMQTAEILKEYGYYRYEISNYAREGKECIHNCGYWTRRDYAGFGLGAASMAANTRWNNVKNLEVYIKSEPGGKKENLQKLSVKEQMEEFMFLGLRMRKGVSGEKFFRIFGASLEDVYGTVIDRYVRTGLLKKEENRIYLTDRGIDVSNYILSDFLLSV